MTDQEFFLLLHCYVLKQVCGGENLSYPVTKQIPLHRYKNRKGLYIYIIFHNIITIGAKTSHNSVTTRVYIVTSIVTKSPKSVTKPYFCNITYITFLPNAPKVFYLFCNNHLTLSSRCVILVSQVENFFLSFSLGSLVLTKLVYPYQQELQYDEHLQTLRRDFSRSPS